MVLTVRPAGFALSILTGLLLVSWGCQGQSAKAPAAEAEPVRSVPVRASEEVSSVKSRVSSGEPTLQTSDLKPHTSEEPPHGVPTSETVPETKKAEVDTDTAGQVGPEVELALKFSTGQAATYRVTTEVQKSVEWKGSTTGKPPKFTGGRTGNHVEITFEQRVKQVQDDGSGILEVTIKGVKYLGEAVNKVVLDFDSARPEDSTSPLAALVGKSYVVKVSARGKVLEISNVEAARLAVQGGLPANNVATRILSQEEIRNRHEIVALSTLQDRLVHVGRSWSNIRTFSFDDMGVKTYERVYTLKEVRQASGRLAVVEMKAIPSTAMAEEIHKRQTMNPFARMSDNIDSYSGRLELDLDSGQVRECVEQMQNEWTIVDPSTVQEGQPAAIKMAARRLYKLERVQKGDM